MQLNHRFYAPYFSVHVILCLIGTALLGLSFTPLARIPVERAVNQDLTFSFRYLALFLYALGFRGNSSLLKALHMVFAVLLGIVPTLFLCLFALMIFPFTFFTGIVSVFTFSVDPELLKVLFTFCLQMALLASFTAGTWLIIFKWIFAQYKEPYELDAQSRLNTVVVLLMFFGGLGAHRFFVGKVWSGLLFLMTMGLLGLGVLFDGGMLILRRFSDADGNTV